jgi:hypothetical protein
MSRTRVTKIPPFPLPRHIGLGGLLVTLNLQLARAINTFLMGLAAGVMLLLSVVDMIYPVVRRSGIWPALPLVLLGAGLVALLDLAVGSFDLDAALASLARSSSEGIMSTFLNPFVHFRAIRSSPPHVPLLSSARLNRQLSQLLARVRGGGAPQIHRGKHAAPSFCASDRTGSCR